MEMRCGERIDPQPIQFKYTIEMEVPPSFFEKQKILSRNSQLASLNTHLNKDETNKEKLRHLRRHPRGRRGATGDLGGLGTFKNSTEFS